ncbi:DNA polymerase epsilon catalytic subunit, partial [Globisporangium splendens]
MAQRNGGNNGGNQYRRALSGGSAWARNSQGARANAQSNRGGNRSMTDAKQFMLKKGDALDKKFGFHLLPELIEQEQQDTSSGEITTSAISSSSANVNERDPKLGWLLNLRACSILDPTEGKFEVSAVELYFLEQDGKAFKTRVIYQPYLFVRPEENRSQEVIAYCLRKFEGLIAKAERVSKEDLDMPNHLSGKKAMYVKLSFYTVSDLVTVKQALAPIVEKNQAQQKARQAYELQGTREQVNEEDHLFGGDSLTLSRSGMDESESALLGLREYDVPYSMRVAIDLNIRVGAWYHVNYDPASPYAPSDIKRLPDMVDKAEPVVCAFDIETTKLPLKFPDAQFDQIYMISYMIDRQGYLIVNREFVSEDIQDFEYTPKKDYPGPFIVFNEENEEQLLKRFFEHIVDAQPHIFVTYNGDFFDWPFIDARSKFHGINMADEIGISLDIRSGEYRGRSSVHMDAFCWVKRDSYLPQGSQGLKAVTKYKLGYDPVEVDAEDMLPLARDDPLKMASYSVSDAVATFYLYEKYVHLFVFSLCTIIPLGSEDVLRKGSGTLCEALLMVEAFEGGIICPNKQSSAHQEKFYKGHLVESETYVGGHVECLESGVFRADFLYDFNLVPSAFQQLIDNIDRDLRFSLVVEMDVALDRVANYDEVKAKIVGQLEALRDRPTRKEKPLIYHLDVAAMYPNIILTNRLQPCAIVNEADCATCVYNTECGKSAVKDKDESCQRDMDWVWRGDFYPATRPEYFSIKTQLEYENFPVGPQGGAIAGGGSSKFGGENGNNTTRMVPFGQLNEDRQEQLIKQRFKSYCSSVYKRTKITEQEKRAATVCMRENPFYVNTVRAFRDRRYDYKNLTKTWKKKQAQAEAQNDLLAKIEAQNKCLVYDSLQLAHKCILNSFYGYVMRKGARWHSMEMAGIVTHTGSNIITGARQLVEQIGRPLELDTDGIWAILPASFPETFSFKLNDGSSRSISYPCVMLNADVNAKFTNPQYHELDPETGKYKTHQECSILFEVDGPYKAMVLPASTEEGRLLKKRYAVFNFDHSLAELKGFELKRRGELQLIKAFQSQVFECFLDGENLEECYASVAKCANRWLDVIDTKGKSMDNEELMELITENKSMSGKLEEYEGQKSTSITTAKRLSEFLGESMVKDRGLTCKMIIAAKPYGEKVTERAIPTAIFSAEEAVKRHFLKKWLKDPNLQDFDIRAILDWEYYRGRFASTIQKIISLPAAFQNVKNPVPRIELPDWMRKQVRERNAKHQQGSLAKFVTHTKKDKANANEDYIAQLIDLEDLALGKKPSDRSSKLLSLKQKRKRAAESGNSSAESTEELNEASSDASAAEQDPIEDVEMVPAAPVKLGEVAFSEWLKNRKAKWKTLLVKRKRQREERARDIAGSNSMIEIGSIGPSAKRHQTMTASRTTGGRISMENFVLNTASALHREFWQIVEVQQEQDGHFTCWVITTQSQMLHRITLKMPRVFYLACDEADSHIFTDLPLFTRRVLRVIPHLSSKPQPVVEIMVSEQQFQQNHKELNQILNDPVIKGVYELQVSALTRAVCSLGCVVKVVNPHHSGTNQEYEFSDLQFQSTAQVPYLVDLYQGTSGSIPAPLMRRVLLYFSQQKNRAILGLVVLKDAGEDSSSDRCEGDATVWYVDPVSNVKARGSDLEHYFDQLLQGSVEEGVESVMMQSCSFKTHVVKSVQDAFSGVNSALARLASNKQMTAKPTIVIAQTCIPSTKRLREKMQGLHSFPMAMLPWNEEDTLFPALTWRKIMSEKMIARCFEMAQYFQEVLDCARYAHLPVGNFTGDHSIAILDTLYSRILTKNKHLWWHSPSSVPDLGGKEQEQYQHLFSDSLLAKAQHGKANATHRTDTSAVVCDKGSYPDICVELELDGLAVNAILVAAQIQSIEGIGGAHQMEIDFDTDDASGANAAGAKSGVASGETEEPCQEAFRLLRLLVTTLFKDFLTSRNKFADHLLQQFYRWVCSSNSLCYDPGLQAMVKRLMEKLFLQLLAEFRRLGSQIVFADFSKIILCTKKQDMKNAQTYLQFILQTVLSNELFQVLSFTPKKYFSNLFFLDSENYGGILLKNASEQDAAEEEEEKDDQASGDAPLDIISHWNIANYLPKGIDEYFLVLVGQFIRRRAEFQLRERAKLLSGASSQANKGDEQEDEEVLDEAEKKLSPLAKYSQRLVASYFSEKLLRIVPEIQSYNMDRDSFPVFAGSHLLMEHPALELVKFVSAVFQLEPSVEAQLGKMRRTLLKLLHVSEFSDDAQFVNPSLSFAVPDVICLCCNLCRSVDLCRDPQLFKGSSSRSNPDASDGDDAGDQDPSSAVSSWHCPRCFALYDKHAFEQRLVEMVEAQSVQYQLQDLYCQKCHLPAEHKMREYCTCSGTYGHLPGAKEELQETLRILRRIAQQHEFEWLLETVQRLELQ